MPTGYTAGVVDGKVTNFNDFVLQCARAFGALITLRDERMDAPIPEQFEPSDYNQKKLIEVREGLVKLNAMTKEQVAEACKKDCEEKVAQENRYKAQQILENQRLDAMIKQVKNWEPPTDDHEHLKVFMLNQLRISKHDPSYYERYGKGEKITPNKWLEKKMQELHRDIGYHAAEQEKEIERAKERTLWVKQLRESLKVKA